MSDTTGPVTSNGAENSSDAGIAQVIDAYLDWFVAWHRLAFIYTAGREAATKLLPLPPFAGWYRGPAQSLQHNQPAIHRLAKLHDQLHTLAKLVLMRTPEGSRISEADYEAVAGTYQTFLHGMRRIECVFTTAAARLDLLTGLRTRIGLAEDVGSEIDRFARSKRPFCVAIMDLDHFKNINDTLGHDAGDRVLAAAANCVSRQIRAYDEAYRLGGEEFLIMLKDTDAAQARLAVERLRAALEVMPVIIPGRQPFSVTASFGVAAITPGMTADKLLETADQALYQAKRDGRNRVVMAAAG